MPDGPIRILLVDDHAMVRRGMRDFLSLDDDIEVVGEASDGLEAVERATELRPDIVVMDLMMPNLDGIDATSRIKASLPEIEVIALTSFIEEARVVAAIEAGASGFLLKDADPARLLDAVRVVADGGSLLAPSVTRRVIEHFGAGRPNAEPHPEIDRLTDREREIVGWVATGRSNAEIAKALVVSPDTVRTHVSRAMVKLRARDRAQLVVFAIQSGLEPPEPR